MWGECDGLWPLGFRGSSYLPGPTSSLVMPLCKDPVGVLFGFSLPAVSLSGMLCLSWFKIWFECEV